MPLRFSPRLISLAALLVAMFFIQSGASIAKELFLVWGVFVTTMVRTGFGFAFLSIFWFPKLYNIRKAWKPALCYGIALGLMNLTFYQALSRIPLGLAVALEFIGPLGLSLVKSRKLTDLLWACLAAFGVLLLLFPGFFAKLGSSPSASLDLTGVLFALLAAIAWAFYIVFGKNLGQSLEGGQAASLGMLGAALVTFPFGISEIDKLIENAHWIFSGIALALLSSSIPYALEMFALREIPTKTFGILMALEPVVAAILGYLLLGEVLSLPQVMAVFLITIAGQGSLWSRH